MDRGRRSALHPLFPYSGCRTLYPHIFRASTWSSLASGFARCDGGPHWTVRRLVTRLHPPAVHDVVLIRDRARLLRGEEDDDLRHLGRLQLALQALPGHDLGLALRCHPLLELTLRHDPPRRDGVYAYAVDAEVAGERARQTQHGGF